MTKKRDELENPFLPIKSSKTPKSNKPSKANKKQKTEDKNTGTNSKNDNDGRKKNSKLKRKQDSDSFDTLYDTFIPGSENWPKRQNTQIKNRNNADNSIYNSQSFNDYKENDEKLPIDYLIECAKQEVKSPKKEKKTNLQYLLEAAIEAENEPTKNSNIKKRKLSEKSDVLNKIEKRKNIKQNKKLDHTKNESRKEKDVGILSELTLEYDNEQPLDINTESRRLETKSECEGVKNIQIKLKHNQKISLDQNEDKLVIRIPAYIPKENSKTKKALKSRNKKVKRVMDNPIKESKNYPNDMFPVKIIGDKKIYLCPWKGWDDMPETCNKQWDKLTLVKRHYHSHTGIKGIECPSNGCNRMFTRKDFMKRHLKESCKYKDEKDKKVERDEKDGKDEKEKKE
ncbi:zinc finger C2H2 domain-containing protein [Vairimorpha necatrix]|uniref:Zinc finger C2H2 domain-containing protein n=1 Tax=Vairimorpha necatrix TaxID=6039 RepID=A0AAX4JFC3_9MICR